MKNQKATDTAEKAPQTKRLSKIRIFFGLLLLILSVLMAGSFISYLMNWQADQSQAGMMLDRTIKSSNIFGKLGDWLGKIFIFDSIGVAAFLVAFLLFVIGLLIMKKRYFKPWKTIGHSLFFICWLPIFFGAITQGDGTLSGVYGSQIVDFLQNIIGKVGLWVIIISSLALYFILEFNLRPSAIRQRWQQIQSKISSAIPTAKHKDQASAQEDEETEFSTSEFETFPAPDPFSRTAATPAEPEVAAQHPTVPHTPVQPNVPVTPLADFPPVEIKKELDPVQTPNHTGFSEFTQPEPVAPTVSLSVDDVIAAPPSPTEAPEVAFNYEVAENPQENFPPTSDETLAEKLVSEYGLYDHRLELPKYQFPTLSLLRDYGSEEISINKEELEENKNKIVGLLKNFNVGIAEIKATIGPTVTLYEIIPEAGIRVSSIKKLQDDIALNLSALGIRIIAPMPGKGTIGIEVPRKNPTMVSMRSVLASQKFQHTDMDLPVVFGKTISNEVYMADLSKMPHLLMSGATGQGKSVGINAILTSLLYKKHPSELKFVMVDPKKVELSLYSKIERHYLAKLPDAEDAIITDTSKVVATLNSLCVEMDQRYDLMRIAMCRTIKEYNKKFSERKLNPENGHRYFPYIVLVVDEFADLIMTAGKEIELPIARLAQLARAVGIHLIVATQRPSVNVITGMIKANFPARVAFRVMSSVDSRTILDAPGADQLIGKGDMLIFNGSEILRLQCAFVDTPEVEQIVDFIGAQKGYSSAFLLPEYTSEDGSSGAGAFDPNEKDALFDEAARIVVSTQQGSTSMLQRQLKLGYNRAGRIMDQLEGAGIVGGFNGAKAREVLIGDLNQLEQLLQTMK